MADPVNTNVIRRQSEDIAGLTTAGTGGLIPGQMGEVVGTTLAPLATLVFKREIDNTFGYVKSSQVYSAADTTAMVALADPLQGDVCNTADGKSYMLNSNDPSTLADWVQVGGSAVDLANVPLIGFDKTTPASPVEGQIWYDDTDNTLCVQSDIANTVLNVGQEQLIRCVNKTLSTILDGTVVYISGAQGNRPTITAASYTDTDSANKTIGVVTADIANNAEGYVCISGIVNGYNTSGYTAGDKLYLSTAGGLTNVRPSYGIVSVAYALNSTSGATGKILVVLHRGIVKDGVIPFSGFDNPDNVLSVYSVANQTITLSRISTSETAILYYNGDVVFDLALGNHVSSARPAGNGLWFYKWNGSAYSWSTATWTFSEAQLGMVYKSATAEFGIVESHGYMEAPTHRRLHETIGTSAVVMPASSGLVFNSTTAANRRPAYTSATLRDEDITVVLDATPANNFTKFHVGAGNVSVFAALSTDIVELNTDVPRVNNPATGAWTDLTANQYMNIFVIDVPTMSDTGSKVYRKWFVNGQLASTTRATIDGQLPSSIVLGDISKASQEFVFTKRILIRYAAGNWTVISETDILGTKVSQITTPSLGAVALPSLVTGGLGLIPVGTTASGHTVFDGSAGSRLSFDTANGLIAECNSPEAIHARYSSFAAGSKAGICFELLDSVTPFTAYKCYAEAFGEIVGTNNTGAFVIKAMTAGVLGEAFRAVNGKVGIGRTPVTEKLEIESTANWTGLQVIGATVNPRISTSRGSGALNSFSSDLIGGYIGTETSHPLIFQTNNTTAITIGTDQSATFESNVTFKGTKGIRLTGAGAPTTAGDFAFSTAQKQYCGSINGSNVVNYVPTVMYSAYASAADITSGTETTIISATRLGSLNLGIPIAGQRYSVMASGEFGHVVANVVTFRLKMSNSTVLTIATPDNIYQGYWVLDISATWVSATSCNVSATLATSCNVSATLALDNPATSTPDAVFVYAGTVTGVTAAAAAMNLTAQNSGSTGTSVICHESSCIKYC